MLVYTQLVCVEWSLGISYVKQVHSDDSCRGPPFGYVQHLHRDNRHLSCSGTPPRKSAEPLQHFILDSISIVEPGVLDSVRGQMIISSRDVGAKLPDAFITSNKIGQ